MGKWQKIILHAVLALLFVALGFGGFMKLGAQRPRIKKKRPHSPLPLVEVIEAEKVSHMVRVHAYGNVKPAQEVQVVAEVSGRVTHVSPSLIEGGFVREGELLVRLDPRDYQIAVTLAKARIKEAESRILILEAESQQAREEWALEGGSQGIKPPPLVLKGPQLEAARAALEAARAQLQKALLDLERTELRAPFDDIVKEEQIGFGQYVSKGQSIATIYGIDVFHVLVGLEREELKWLKIPGFSGSGGPGSKAMVHASIGGKRVKWRGRVVRAGAHIDERTRLVPVIVEVAEPYAKTPPLAAGLFVEVEIMGPKLGQVVRIPRSALRPTDRVWVVGPDRTVFDRKVKVATTYGDVLVVEEGIQEGDLVVVSPLKVMTRGMKVRITERTISP